MYRMLIVDDEKNERDCILYLLKNCGFELEIKEAEDGVEALQILKIWPAHILFTDVQMPRMDGFELIKELRECDYKVPILIITAKSDIQDKKQGFLLGADDYMVKPIDIEELILRVQVLLKRSKSANEKRIQIGDLVLNYNQMSVTRKEKVYSLAQKEFLLLYK